MEITNEQLISFETAKLAKEKGFKELVCNCFTEIDMMIKSEVNLLTYPLYGAPKILETIVFNGREQEVVLRPTQSLLQKWLRDNYNIDISIHRSFSMNKSYHYTILINCDYDNIIQQICEPNRNYETSLELALQEALKTIK